MKKWLGFLLVLTVFTLTACGSGRGKDNSSGAPVSEAPQATSTAAPAEETVQVAKIKDTDVGLNVRKSPSTDADVLTIAKEGACFYLGEAGEKDGWYQIKYEDALAYVSAEYVEIKSVTASEAAVLVAGEEAAPEQATSEDPKAPAKTAEPTETAEPEDSEKSFDGE